MGNPVIHLTPFELKDGFHLVADGGNELFRTFAGNEQDVAKLLASDPHWTVVEQNSGTYLVFNTATFRYVIVYPERKVEGEKMSTKDLITVTRILSSFTGIGFYLDVK